MIKIDIKPSFFAALLSTVFCILSAYAQDVYVLDKGNSRLYNINENSPGTANILLSTIPSPSGMAIDSNTGDIYYTDNSNTPTSGRIIRVNRDGTNQTTVASNLNMPGALAIDENLSTVYFIAGGATPSIFSVSTSGGAVSSALITGNAGSGPKDLDIDHQNGKIYWTDTRDGSIRRATTSGTAEETVVSSILGTLSGIAVDRSNGFVYWINSSTNSIDYVATSDPIPASPNTAISSTLIDIGGLSVDGTTLPTKFFIANNNSKVVLATFGGTATTLLDNSGGAAQPFDIAFFNSTAPTPTPNPVLNPSTQLKIAPIVAVTGKKAVITVTKFTSAVNEPMSAFLKAVEKYNLEAAKNKTPKLVVMYDIRVAAPKKKDNEKFLSKKNTVTAKNLKPGNYTTNYSAVAYTKKSKAQIEKAKQNGQTGFTATNKKVFSTNFSPSAGFNIQ